MEREETVTPPPQGENRVFGLLRAAPMAWGALALGLGLAAEDALRWPWWAWAFPAAAAAAGSWFAGRSRREGLAWAAGLAAALLLGTFRHGVAIRPLPPDHVGRAGLPAKNALVGGVVTEEPAQSAERGTTSLVLNITSLALPGQPVRPASGLVRATLHWTMTDAGAGDVIRLRGTLLPPSPPTNPGQSDFRAAMAHRGIHALLSSYKPGEFSVVSRRSGGRLASILPAVRKWATGRIDALVGPPESGLLASIVFGLASGDFTPEILDSFRATGLMHILVASGLNVGILAWLSLAALSAAGIPRARAGLYTLPILVLYLFLCGAQTPLLRSTLMFGLVLVGTSLGRPSSAVNSLGTAAVFLLMLDPHGMWDRSFQLSFGATLGVLTLVPWLCAGLRPLPRWMAEAAACTISAQIFLLPMLSSLFGQVPLFGALANLFVTPVMGVFLAGGLLLLGVGWIPLAGPALGMAMKWSLLGVLRVVEWFACVPLASVVAPPFSAAAWTAYLAWLAGALLWIYALDDRPSPAHKETPDRGPLTLPSPRLEPPRDRSALVAASQCLALAGAAGLAALAWVAALRPAPGNLAVTFLDVGEGSATVVRLPSGRAILIDGGLPYAGGSVVVPFLKSRGIGRLAAVILSHPHADHLGGLPLVLRHLRVDLFLFSGQGIRADPGFSLLHQALAARRIPTRTAHSGAELLGEPGVRIRFLNPPAGFLRRGPRAEAADNNSAAVAVEFGGTSLLLPGDIKSAGERALAGNLRWLGGPERLMAVPHHGSVFASSHEFLAAVAPRHAVISVGGRNPFGHPHPAVPIRYRDQGAELLRTDQDGAIEAVSDGSRWTLRRIR